MESEGRETACIVNDMSDMVVVDLDFTVTAEVDTENDIPEEASTLDVTQGLKVSSFVCPICCTYS